MNYKIHREMGSGAISVTVSPGYPWELEKMRLHLSGGAQAEAFTVTMSSGLNSAYNTVILTIPATDMSGETDVTYGWNPTERFLHKYDKVVFAHANGGSLTWGLEVVFKPLGG